MPKKPGGRNARRTQRRHLRRLETTAALPTSPARFDAPEASDNGRAPREPAAETPRYVVGSKSAPSATRRSSGSLLSAAVDYSYVRVDLRRIGVLSGVVVFILLVLTFWLR